MPNKEALAVNIDIKAFEEKQTNEGSFGYFEGYAATFGNLDRTYDVIEKGAFKSSLRERDSGKGYGVKLCWQHEINSPIGSFTEMFEDNNGLFVKARINLGTEKGREAYALIKAGDLNQMSIGYMAREFDYEEDGVRTLKEIDLYEISIVTEPANTNAVITEVKSVDDLDSLAEVENLLRKNGFSRKEAKAFVSKVKTLSQRDADDQDVSDDQRDVETEEKSTTDPSVQELATLVNDLRCSITKLQKGN